MSAPPLSKEFVDYLLANQYYAIRPLPGGRWGALFRFMFTWAIIVGRTDNTSGYEDRWCYHRESDAEAAWAEWDGVGEPRGWQRHPLTGRYQDLSDDFLIRKFEEQESETA